MLYVGFCHPFSAAVSRLRAAHEKLCEELRSEQELEEQLTEELQKAESVLTLTHIF